MNNAFVCLIKRFSPNRSSVYKHLRAFIHCTLYIIHCTLLFSCEEEKKPVKSVPYVGPIEEIKDVNLRYSEAALLKVKLTTARQFRFLNDDRKYPDEVHIDFYDPSGQQIVTTLRSDSGRYDRGKDLYTVMGHVVVVNKQKQEKLQTNLLNWNPNTKKVFTENKVIITSQLTGEKLYGLGMDADQDFSRYSIRKPSGTFNL
ncbi:LPS export ABC transporter periplasmic protein LptC [Fibrella sp. HMF5036]|uniref:LPS export ABC transporter periplasmic protein LptC n=1 Tax=Fibrella aquatilis TaxID=2817059 RepID=A0A939G7M4_9BACT|nr:LPS export ABC transporter periplasmic protein LptC [Fibrella aquatilis]